MSANNPYLEPFSDSTDPGPNASRVDVLKAALLASALVPESMQALQARTVEFFRALKPQNLFQNWILGQMVVISLRLDRLERMERRVRDKIMLRAELFWGDNQRLKAIQLGERIGRQPRSTLESLRQSVAGCDWLIERWSMLAYAADLKTSWSPDQVKLAFDLLGTPAEFREGFPPGATIDTEGRVIDSGLDPAGVARRQIAELKKRRELVCDLDEINRHLAKVDLFEGDDAEIKQLRREESALQTRLRWCLKQMQTVTPYREPSPILKTEWASQPAPEEVEEEAPKRNEPNSKKRFNGQLHPPFNLEPHEIPPPGVEFDAEAVLKARRENEAKQEDARRAKRRRKLEKLRA